MSDNPAPMEPLTLGGHAGEPPGEIAITVTADKDGCDSTQAEVDEGAFLLPVWHPGFWVMPPGGLTRYLFPPRGFINPDQTLMSALTDDAVNRATN